MRSPSIGTTPADASALTRENPKGKLLEFCARAKCSPPQIHLERGPTRTGAQMVLVIDGETFDSGMHWAADRRVAEQLAAKALLEELAQTEEEAGGWVTDEDAIRLRRENPKGLLLEKCIRLGLQPRFDVRPIVTAEGPGFEAGAFIEKADGEEVWGELRRAAQAKTAEQATAASLLQRLENEVAPAPATSDVGREPRGVLNEMQQSGALRAYGFDVETIEGPPHAPVFHMKGFAVRTTGERIEVANITASSKKEGERRAAQQLLERLIRTP